MKSALVQSSALVASHSCTFGKKLSLFSLLIISLFFSYGQDSLPIPKLNGKKDTSIVDITIVRDSSLQRDLIAGGFYSTPLVPKQRKWLIAGINFVAYGGSLIILNNTWYKNYPHTSFHVFNDSREWLQVDKVGHTWTAYNTGRASTAMWKWSGLSDNTAALIGGLSGTAYLTVIELLDAHSSKWGWSWADMGANLLGSGIFLSQQLAWNEQRVQFKFSFHHKNYGDPQLEQRADDLFGKTWYERMLKDYNAQTYWLSANLKSFFKQSNLPAWLNISVGYGADGMFGGFENQWTDKLGNNILRNDISRKRQFYLAPDIDFTKIKTNSKFLRTIFSGLNAFKCPAPALMIDSKGKLKAYAFYF